MNYLGKLCSCHSTDIPSDVTKEAVVHEVDEGQPCENCSTEKCQNGFKLHSWRHVCEKCRCPRTDHQVSVADSVDVYDRLALSITADVQKSRQSSRDLASKLGYTWVPPGLGKQKVDDYMSQLDSDDVPKISSSGAQRRHVQLIVQLPAQDLAARYCRHLSTDLQQHVIAFDEFRRTRDADVIDVAQVTAAVKRSAVCGGCRGNVDAGRMAVVISKAASAADGGGGSKCTWHPGCFRCFTCQQLLVDLCYCYKSNNVYCERHYAELIRPRCRACDELIFASETTKAMNREWHEGHFACFLCDKSLVGSRYVIKDSNAYCPSCYETLFCHKCDACNQLIGVGGKDLEHNDHHWHAACFYCSDCNKSLVDLEFAIRDGRLYCADCHENNFAPRCDHCKQVFRTGMKKFEYDGRKWHEECFQCDKCHQPIRDQKFAPADDDGGGVICVHCYEQAYAPRCHNCNGPISKSGVTYKQMTWHRECFRCTHCARLLADDKFTPHNDKPYCVPCFGELFAKKCELCTKPITGPGTTKFASFDNRHWHNECFVCSKCRVSLVGQGFLLDGADIICTGCAPV